MIYISKLLSGVLSHLPVTSERVKGRAQATTLFPLARVRGLPQTGQFTPECVEEGVLVTCMCESKVEQWTGHVIVNTKSIS